MRMFAEKVGVAKREQLIDLQLMEWCVRQDLNERSNRYMVVQDPVKLTITNWEPGKVEWFDAPLNPADPEGPSRKVPFTGEVYIERNDFMEEPPKKYFRLKPDGEVRLKYTYIIKCQEVVKDAEGNIVEIRCTYDPTSKPEQASGVLLREPSIGYRQSMQRKSSSDFMTSSSQRHRWARSLRVRTTRTISTQSLS